MNIYVVGPFAKENLSCPGLSVRTVKRKFVLKNFFKSYYCSRTTAREVELGQLEFLLTRTG